MNLLTPLLAMVRARQLNRQFRTIERHIHALPPRSRTRLSTLALREVGQASLSDFPHLYGTPPEARFLAWGQGTEVGYERAASGNNEVALRGMALWLAVAYHETKNSGMQPQYRQLMGLLRELKQMQKSTGGAVEDRTEAGEAA